MPTQNLATDDLMNLDDLYALIMGAIEPDLLLENIDTLDEVYKDETAEQNQLRLERYQAAFADCNHVWSQCMSRWESSLKMAALRANMPNSISSTQ